MERDPFEEVYEDGIVNFNSHAHVERDSRKAKENLMKNISTHTLTWSVTLLNPDCLGLGKFQLTRSRGA